MVAHGVDSILLNALSQARDPSLSSCVFVFFVGHDQLHELFLALMDYPQLRFDSGAWVKGRAFSMGASMRYNQEHIVYVWSKDCKAILNEHCDVNDPERRVLIFPMTTAKLHSIRTALT